MDESTLRTNGRNTALSLIRVTATLAVVMLHTCYMSVSLYGSSLSTAGMTVAMTVVHSCMAFVPLFVMVTGALLLAPDKELTIEKLLKRYVLRIVAALIVFSIIYKAFDIVMSRGQEAFGIEALKDLGLELITGTGWSHMWYLYMLLALYLLMPAFRCIARAASDGTIIYLVIVGFIWLCVIPLSRKVTGVVTAVYIDIATVYPVYLFLGYAIERRIISLRWCSPLLVIIGIGGIAFASVMQYVFGNGLFESFCGYSSPFTFAASAGLFGLLIEKDSFEDRLKKAVDFIDPATFGIYLIHIIILRGILRYAGVNPFTEDLFSAVNIVLIAAVSFTVSLLITKGIKALTKGCRFRFL